MNLHPIHQKESTNVRFSEGHSAPGASQLKRSALGKLSAVFPGLFADWAVAQMTRPRRYPRPELESRQLHGAKEFELLPGVVGWEWGNGPSVLLVHGWEGRGSQLGALVAPLLARGFRVLTFDAIAHGDSRGHRATLADFVAGIFAAERRVGELHAIITHSFGGPAASLAVQRGLRVNALAYLAPPASLAIDTSSFAGSTGLSARAVESMKLKLERHVNVTFEELDVTEFGSEMRTPLYIVHDEGDRDVRAAAAAAYAKHWPDAVVKFTRGLGHRGLLKDAQVAEDVAEYVASVPGPPRVSDLASWLPIP